MYIFEQLSLFFSLLSLGFALGVIVTHHMLVKPLEGHVDFWHKAAVDQLGERANSLKRDFEDLKMLTRLLDEDEPTISPFQVHKKD